MDATIVLPVVATILVTILVVWRYRETVESAYSTFEYLRKTIGAILIVLVAWTFLRSGSLLLFTFALGLIVFATIWFLIEQPHRATP